jgi:hypothetical protein
MNFKKFGSGIRVCFGISQYFDNEYFTLILVPCKTFYILINFKQKYCVLDSKNLQT